MGRVAVASLPARSQGWEARLVAELEAVRRAPYRLGEHDCFRFSCRVIAALTGVDLWPAYAGYRTRREALAVMARYGRSFEAFVDHVVGAPSVDVRHARRGDICALQTEDCEKHLGVCLGAEVAFLSEAGLVFVPTLSCLCCWRIG
jgi:hypothetical protein